MKSQQSGFTLVEIAIVLVIIGLLLGGILKGQELINSAKVKNLANDFRVIPTYIYAYQDKFRALPGDDKIASTHLAGEVVANDGDGDGLIEGAWNATSGESFLFWRHVRLANLAAGPTATEDGAYAPTNAVGGRLGVNSTSAGVWITGMTGTYQICSGGIQGKFAKQLDVQMDDGNTTTGSMRTGSPDAAGAAVDPVNENDNYTVCMTF